MKKTLMLVLMLASVFSLTACSQKKIVRLESKQPAPGITQEKDFKAEAEEKIKEEKLPEEAITEQQVAKTDIPVKTEIMDVFEFKDIYFDFDRYEIKSDARPVLQKTASLLLKNTSAKILIEGHCDERGTNEYNLALGDKRAKATKDFLIALGVTPNRIEIISYGEEKPLCTEQKGECWQKNRRAHFVFNEYK